MQMIRRLDFLVAASMFLWLMPVTTDAQTFHNDVFRSKAVKITASLQKPTGIDGLLLSAYFDPEVPQMLRSKINEVCRHYKALFKDSVEVNLYFHYWKTDTDGNALGANTIAMTTQNFVMIPYATFLAALKADRETPYDDMAINSIGAHTPESPVVLTTPNARALGLITVVPDKAVGTTPRKYDAVITINPKFTFQYDRTGGPVAGQIDIEAVIEHEINHALGFNSVLPTTPPREVFPLDYYRYVIFKGRPTWTLINSVPEAYFSLDGGNKRIAAFNQQPQYGHWTNTCLVQSANACPGAPFVNTKLTSPEGIALDIIGYDPR